MPRRCSDVMLNEQEFSHLNEWVEVKILTHEYRIWVALWNIDPLIDRFLDS